MKRIILTAAAVISLAGSVLGGTAHAAGTAAFSLSPASGTLTQGNNLTLVVSENADANAVTAKLTYDASKLQCNGASNAFGSTISATCGGGSVTISGYAAPGTTASGTVGTVNFTVLGNAGSTSIAFATGSQIANNGTNLWNGSTAGASYSLTAPATTTPPTTGSGSSNTGSSSSNSSSNSSTSSNTANTSATKNSTSTATNSTSTATTDTDADSAATSSSDTTKSDSKDKTLNIANANAKVDSSKSGWVWSSILVIVAAAAAIVYWTRFRTPAVAPVATAKKKTTSKKA
jgi:hypothetical protein